MPLLDIEKQLFVCKDQEGTIQITVKNAGTGSLKLWDVFPIGKCRSHIDINFSRNPIEKQTSAIINVTINNYWEPAEIQFDTNCPRTGKIIYVLFPRNLNIPNLWLFPNEKYNRNEVFFHDPEPHLRLPIIVRSNSDNPLEFDFCFQLAGKNTDESADKNTNESADKNTDESADKNTNESADKNTNENSATSHKIDVYCGETGREVSLKKEQEQGYQILNTQEENYQVHFANIHLPKTIIEDGPVGHAIQFTIYTNSHLKKLRKQEISIQFTEIEVEPISRKSWSKWRKSKRAELEIRNLGTHPLRIFGIPTDLDKIEVEYLETDSGRITVSYPIVIQENESKKLGIAIKSRLKEWLWSGIDLSNILVPIYTNTVSDPKKFKVFTGELKIKSARIFWISLVALAILGLIIFFVFLRPPEREVREVIVSSYPPGQTVRVDGEEAGTTPTLLKVNGNARIRIRSSNEILVKDVPNKGTIFFAEGKWKVGKGE